MSFDLSQELRQHGQGATPQAESLAQGTEGRLNELLATAVQAVNRVEKCGIQRPAPTVAGRLEQARRDNGVRWKFAKQQALIHDMSIVYTQLGPSIVIWPGETELDTPEVDTSSHFGNTRSRCIKQYPELGTPDLNTPELDTT